MRIKLRSFLWKLVGIVAILELPPKKARVQGCYVPYTIQQSRIGLSIHFLGESAKHFRESLSLFWSALKFAAYSARNCAKTLYLARRYSLSDIRQSQVHNREEQRHHGLNGPAFA